MAADVSRILWEQCGKSNARRILVKHLTRTRELTAREYTDVSRPVTTSRSAQDLCTEDLILLSIKINGLLVSSRRFFQCSKNAANLSVGPKTGTGRCFYRVNAGNYTAQTDNRQYAAARLVSKGTVQRPVRAPNQQNVMHMLTCI